MKGTVLLLFLCLLMVLIGCRREELEESDSGRVILNFSRFKLPSPEHMARLIAEFETSHPGIRVRETVLPASTDQQHQRYVIELGARARHIDILAADVIWIAEFARAGWLEPLDEAVTTQEAPRLLPAPRQACTFRGRLYAFPWFIDAGLLYYRKDLLKKYGFPPPRTFGELVHQTRTILDGERNPRLAGFIWQGKQYEGLVCNFLEYLWGHGGEVLGPDGRIVVDSPAARKALRTMHNLIHVHRITPAYVTTFDEDASRRMFQNGDAVFLRSWPYVWVLAQKKGSRVRGRVGVTVMPHAPGFQSGATLGGWNLAVNRFSRHPKEAWAFIRFLTSPQVQKRFATMYGRYPTRDALYRDRELQAQIPVLAAMHRVFLHTRPRPVSPFYPQISAVLQTEVSAVLAEVHDPERATREMADQMAFLVLE